MEQEKEKNELRGAVVARYGSMAECGRAIGWSGRRVRDVVTGRQPMTVDDAETLADALSVKTVGGFMRLFFPRMSIQWTDSEQEG